MSKNVVRMNSKGVVTVALTRLGEGVPNLTEIAKAVDQRRGGLKRKEGIVVGPLPLLPSDCRPTWMD